MTQSSTKATKKATDQRMRESNNESPKRYIYESTNASVEQSRSRWASSHIRPDGYPAWRRPPLIIGVSDPLHILQLGAGVHSV